MAQRSLCSQLIIAIVAYRFKINPGNLARGLVSCTGAQFCGVAIIETKNRAMAIVEKLEQQLDIPEAVRIHWTGCPNSCGQVTNPLSHILSCNTLRMYD